MKLDGVPNDSDNELTETVVVFIGDSQCGKSTLIQTFLKPAGKEVAKDPKPTFALEYNFARRKHPTNSNGPKMVTHMWELGGDIYEPSLLDIPLAIRTISTASVVICCDLSKPQNVFSSLYRWLNLLNEIMTKKRSELQITNQNIITSMTEASLSSYAENPDKSKVKPSIIPVYIVCSKYDSFKNLDIAKRRALLIVIRFIAHFYGATVVSTSSAESAHKEAFRNFLTAVCFQLGVTSGLEVAPEKPFYVAAGADSFDKIFATESKDLSKSQLLTGDGIARDCWARMAEAMEALFGVADAAPEEHKDDGEDVVENKFPEPEVDEARAQRDATLQRYVQEVQRRAAMLARMNTETATTGNDAGDEEPSQERVREREDRPRRSKK